MGEVKSCLAIKTKSCIKKRKNAPLFYLPLASIKQSSWPYINKSHYISVQMFISELNLKSLLAGVLWGKLNYWYLCTKTRILPNANEEGLKNVTENVSTVAGMFLAVAADAGKSKWGYGECQPAEAKKHRTYLLITFKPKPRQKALSQIPQVRLSLGVSFSKSFL